MSGAVTRWHKVVTKDYYGRYESAGELDLKDGMRIRVRWPNTVKTTEKLIVVKGYASEQIDMTGGPDRFPTRELFIEQKFNGLKVRVPLRGLNITPEVKR